jgi:hypothetical protein
MLKRVRVSTYPRVLDELLPPPDLSRLDVVQKQQINDYGGDHEGRIVGELGLTATTDWEPSAPVSASSSPPSDRLTYLSTRVLW